MKTETKQKHGGARPGSGRKPKLQYEARESFYAYVDERQAIISEKLDALVQKGDFPALKWLMEQRIGKAPQSLDLTSLGQQINPPSESVATESLIEYAEELLRISKTEGVEPKEAIKKLREWTADRKNQE